MDEEVQNWLKQLRGGVQQDHPVVSQLRAVGAQRLFPLMREMVTDSDAELRCQAALAIFYVDPTGGLDILLGLLDDPEIVVRWYSCGLLHDIGDPRAVEPLIRKMKTDPDPQVRNTAAYALGGIGDPRAIPALIETMDNDLEFDELGHSASSCAATALDDIIKTHHTRIKLSDGLCTMSEGMPDLELLKAQSMDIYHSR